MKKLLLTVFLLISIQLLKSQVFTTIGSIDTIYGDISYRNAESAYVKGNGMKVEITYHKWRRTGDVVTDYKSDPPITYMDSMLIDKSYNTTFFISIRKKWMKAPNNCNFDERHSIYIQSWPRNYVPAHMDSSFSPIIVTPN